MAPVRPQIRPQSGHAYQTRPPPQSANASATRTLFNFAVALPSSPRQAMDSHRFPQLPVATFACLSALLTLCRWKSLGNTSPITNPCCGANVVSGMPSNHNAVASELAPFPYSSPSIFHSGRSRLIGNGASLGNGHFFDSPQERSPSFRSPGHRIVKMSK